MSSPEQISDYGGEIKADSYLERLKQVLEFKGGVILASMLILAVFRGIAPSFENWVLLGSIFVVALTAAVAYRGKVPLVGDEADAVGLGILAVALGGVVLEAVGVQQGWAYPLLASLFVLGTVAYDYWKESTPAEGEWEEEPRKPEVLKVDLVGLVVAELLLSYALLMAGGWVEFAQSPIFIGIAFYFASSVFAIAAGYTVITREIDESEERNEFHEFLIDSLIDIQEIEDERLRNDMATKMRGLSRRLDGVAVPSTIEDSRGKTPIVLPDSDPSKRYRGNTVEGILEAIRSESLTGYVVTEDDDVYLARNGNLVKYYVDGEFGTDTDEIGRAPRTATLFELSHNFLNDVDSLTPSEYEGRVAEESDEGKFESIAGNIGDTSESAETSDEEDNVIQVGGDEVNIDEMFQKADEILEELE